jgi:hypothetical protein
MVLDSKGKMIIPAGKIVDSNFSITYYDSGITSYQASNNSVTFDSGNTTFDSSLIRFDGASITTYYQVGTPVTVTPVKMVSVYEYEIQQNDNKRNIYVLRNRYLQTAIDDMNTIMSYGFSSQYVNDSTKKGENLRVLSPR